MISQRFASRIVRRLTTISKLALAGSVGLLTFVLGAGYVLEPAASHAAVGINQQMNYQGRLLTSSGAIVADGTYNLQFKLYQDGTGTTAGNTGGTLLWTESWLNSNTQGVTVRNGYFSVSLGALCPLSGGSCQGNTNTGTSFNSDTLYLSVNVGGTTTGAPTYDGEMLPMKRLSSSPYAQNAGLLGGLSSAQFLQLAQGVQTDASTTNASIFVNKTGATANVLDIQRGGADVELINNSGQTLFRPTVDSQTALSVQKAGTTTTIFTVDSANTRIGIGTATPGYAVDAVGSVNASVSLKVAGADVCTSSGCTPAAGSSNYIQNTTTQQTANITILSASNTSTATFQGAASSTASVLTLKAGTSATNSNLLLAIDPTGNTVFSIWNTGDLYTNGTISSQNNSTSTGTLYLRSGNSTAAGSGGVVIDAGTAATTNGQISIGSTNASAVNLGRSGISTNVNGNLNVSTGAASVIGAGIKGASGQTANLLQLADNNANMLAGFDANGTLLTYGTANYFRGLVFPATVSTSVTGTTAYYRVSSLNSQGETVAAPEISGGAATTISWTAVSGATAYRIYRGPSAGGETGYVQVTAPTLFLANADTATLTAASLPTGSGLSPVLTVRGTNSSSNLVNIYAGGSAQAQTNLAVSVSNSGSLSALGSNVLDNIYGGSASSLTVKDTNGTSTYNAVGLLLQGVASQAADLFQVKDSGANILDNITNIGEFKVKPNATSATGLLVQDPSGNSLFQIDTAQDRVDIGKVASGTHAAARLFFGDQGGTGTGDNVSIGEGGTTDSDILQLQGGMGFNFTNGYPQSSTQKSIFTLGSNGAAFFQNSADSTAGFQISDAGNVGRFILDTTNTIATFRVNNFNVNNAFSKFTGGTAGSATALSALTGVASNIGLVVQGSASQTADSVEIQNSNGVVESKFDANGNLVTYGANNIYANLATPSGVTSSVVGTTKYYKVSAVNAQGETVASSEVSGGAATTISWTAVPGATSYKVYRGTTAGGEAGYNQVTTISLANADTATLTGTATPLASVTGVASVVQGWNGQTGDLLQFQDASGGIMSKIQYDGSFLTNTNVVAGAGSQQHNFVVNGNAYSGVVYRNSNTEYWMNGFNGTAGTNDYIIRANGSTNVVDMFVTGAVANTMVLKAGNVCIDTATCTNALGVSGNIAASGTIKASSTPDLAEHIPAAPDVVAADVVMADPTTTERVVRANGAYNGAVLGVISDGTSAFMNNHYVRIDGTLTRNDTMPLVLAGRVPVHVTTEGGKIQPGDYLTTSSTTGYAMKANHAGPTIGKSLGFFDGSAGNTVLVLVNVSYYDPYSGNNLQASTGSFASLQAQFAGFQSLNVSGATSVGSLTVTGSAVVRGDLTVSGQASFQAITVAGHITTTGAIPVATLASAAGQPKMLNGVPDIATAPAITVDGTDSAGTITIKTGARELAPGTLAHIAFSQAFTSGYKVVISAGNRQAAGLAIYTTLSNGGFDLSDISQVLASTQYQFNYVVVGSQTTALSRQSYH